MVCTMVKREYGKWYKLQWFVLSSYSCKCLGKSGRSLKKLRGECTDCSLLTYLTPAALTIIPTNRVPLVIAHPQSPNQGKHYKYPVETIDVYATLNDILQLPKSRESTCQGLKCKPLQGKSLAPVLFGDSMGSGASKSSLLANIQGFFQKSSASSPSTSATNTSSDEIPMLAHNFALSQVVRCASLSEIPEKRLHMIHQRNDKTETHKVTRKAIWQDCDLNKKDKSKLVLMGYSMRTPEYRYIAYFHFDSASQKPDLKRLPYEEELYDHKNESLADFTHRETFNLAVRSQYNSTIQTLRTKLVNFIETKVVFGDH